MSTNPDDRNVTGSRPLGSDDAVRVSDDDITVRTTSTRRDDVREAASDDRRGIVRDGVREDRQGDSRSETVEDARDGGSEQRGHEHTGTGYNMVLSTPFVQTVGEDKARAYAQLLQTVAGGADRGADHVTDELHRGLDRIGVQLPEPEIGPLVERLRSAGRALVVTLDDGTVLTGDAALAERGMRSPDVVGTEDPEAPSRPTYS